MAAAASIAIETAVKHILKKIKQGKRLTTEEVLLHLGTMTEEVRAMRAEATERERALREEIAQLRKEMYAKFDAADAKIDAKFDALYAEINRRFDEVNKRLDTSRRVQQEIRRALQTPNNRAHTEKTGELNRRAVKYLSPTRPERLPLVSHVQRRPPRDNSCTQPPTGWEG